MKDFPEPVILMKDFLESVILSEANGAQHDKNNFSASC